MTQEERERLIDFITEAVAYLNDVPNDVIDRNKWVAKSDEELILDADWYEWLSMK